MGKKQDGKSFWTTTLGALTGLAALITAIASLIAALNTAGLLPAAASPTATLIQPTTTQAPPTATLIQAAATQALPTVPLIQATATQASPTATPIPSIQPTPTGPVTAQQIIVVTATPLPSTPTQAAMPTRALGQTVDDFEDFGNTSLQETFKINRNAGNDLSLYLVGPAHVSQGTEALAFEYNIRSNPPRHYVGFDRGLPVQDWSKYSKLCIWVESDASNRNLVIQFGEHNNNFRKSNFPLSGKAGTDYCVSLNTQPPLDLRLIGYYGIYVEGPPQRQGVIYVDNVRLVP
jgi:hypothetical protein